MLTTLAAPTVAIAMGFFEPLDPTLALACVTAPLGLVAAMYAWSFLRDPSQASPIAWWIPRLVALLACLPLLGLCWSAYFLATLCDSGCPESWIFNEGEWLLTTGPLALMLGVAVEWIVSGARPTR